MIESSRELRDVCAVVGAGNSRAGRNADANLLRGDWVLRFRETVIARKSQSRHIHQVGANRLPLRAGHAPQSGRGGRTGDRGPRACRRVCVLA